MAEFDHSFKVKNSLEVLGPAKVGGYLIPSADIVSLI